MEAEKIIFANSKLKDSIEIIEEQWLKNALENAFKEILKNVQIGRRIDGGIEKERHKEIIKKI